MSRQDPAPLRQASRPQTYVDLVAQRSFTVASDTSYIGGKHTVWHLRCFGRGISSVGEGNRNTCPSKAVAEARGHAWVKTGIAPCYQTPLGVSMVSA